MFDLLEVFIAHVASGVLPHGFEHTDDIELLAFVVAGQYGAAIDIDGRHVGTQHAHHAARHVFVATADHQHAVHPLTLHASLDAVTDDFATDQRILHAFGAHGHAI